MPGLPSTKRYYSEDYKESPQWFHRFLSQLNLFTEPIYNILNASAEVMANTADELYILQVNSAHAMGADNTFLFVPKKFIGAPNGIIIGKCLIDNQKGSVSSVNLAWEWTGSQVSILAIYGLAEGRNYTITLRIF